VRSSNNRANGISRESGSVPRQRPVREVLHDYATQMQQILDKYKAP
jgi:hypothetical protein